MAEWVRNVTQLEPTGGGPMPSAAAAHPLPPSGWQAVFVFSPQTFALSFPPVARWLGLSRRGRSRSRTGDAEGEGGQRGSGEAGSEHSGPGLEGPWGPSPFSSPPQGQGGRSGRAAATSAEAAEAEELLPPPPLAWGAHLVPSLGVPSEVQGGHGGSSGEDPDGRPADSLGGLLGGIDPSVFAASAFLGCRLLGVFAPPLWRSRRLRAAYHQLARMVMVMRRRGMGGEARAAVGEEAKGAGAGPAGAAMGQGRGQQLRRRTWALPWRSN